MQKIKDFYLGNKSLVYWLIVGLVVAYAFINPEFGLILRAGIPGLIIVVSSALPKLLGLPPSSEKYFFDIAIIVLVLFVAWVFIKDGRKIFKFLGILLILVVFYLITVEVFRVL